MAIAPIVGITVDESVFEPGVVSSRFPDTKQRRTGPVLHPHDARWSTATGKGEQRSATMRKEGFETRTFGSFLQQFPLPLIPPPRKSHHLMLFSFPLRSRLLRAGVFTPVVFCTPQAPVRKGWALFWSDGPFSPFTGPRLMGFWVIGLQLLSSLLC